MKSRSRVLALGLAVNMALCASVAHAVAIVEPHMKLQTDNSYHAVALTLDACGGKTDYRILDILVKEAIPATVFATGLWIRNNPDAMGLMRSHPELFEIENHGARHVPAIDQKMSIYGIRAAGSAEAVRGEVEGGALAVRRATGITPRWFRGATATYTVTSIALIRSMNFQIAGFSISADGGGLLGTNATMRRMAAAGDGDIMLAHLNRPRRPAGVGVVKGILLLKAKGYRFVKLLDASVIQTDAQRHRGRVVTPWHSVPRS